MKKLKSIDRPWLAYYKEGVSPDLKYSDSSMVGYLLESVARYPEDIAYEYYGGQVTYRDFYEKIKDAAKSLKNQGVNKGDKITICMPNTPAAIIMFYAINMVGAIAAMVHPLSAQNEIERYLNESESSLLFVLDLVYDKARNIIDNTKVKKVVIGSVGDNLKPIKKILYKYKSRGQVPKIELTDDIMTWNEFLNYGYDYDGDIMVLTKPNDPAVILYSGGTSGDPKGILLSNLNFNALALQCHLMVEKSEEGASILAVLPIFHGFGLGVCIHTPLCCGMKLILVPDFGPKILTKTLMKYKPNIICMVPTIFEQLASTKLGKNDLDFLTCAVSGGDFMSAELKHKVDKYFKEHGSSAEVRVGYGLTEASAATCLTPTGEYRDNSIGIPFPDTYYKVVKPGTYDEVRTGSDGELCISGPTVMLGYLNNPKETIKAIQKHNDGRSWLHTGDMASMDKDGFVYYRQRIKRMIVSSGYNVYPSYIEQIINQHESVFTSVVIGIPHPHKVQVAKAYIVLKDGVKYSREIEKSIKEHCERNLAKYALPYEYEFRDDLPKTLVGKVAYRELEKNDKKDEEVINVEKPSRRVRKLLRRIERKENRLKRLKNKLINLMKVGK